MEAMDDYTADAVLTMHACTADIQRWLLSAGLKGKISNSRLTDIARNAERIAKDARDLIKQQDAYPGYRRG